MIIAVIHTVSAAVKLHVVYTTAIINHKLISFSAVQI